MRIAVLAHGTRGDVYPLTALAAELTRRGHHVRLATPVNLTGPGSGLNLDTVPVAWDTQRVLETTRGQDWVSQADPGSFVRQLHELGHEHEERLDGEVIEVCAGHDAIVTGVLLEWRATMLARARGMPLIAVDCFPRRPNDVVPHPLVTTGPQASAAATRATYRDFAQLNRAELREPASRFRRRLGRLAPPSRGPAPRPLELQTYSPALVPGLTWDAGRPFVGDLRMSRSDLGRLGMTGMEPGLARWLAAGTPPALFAFGSTQAADPTQLLGVIGRVCRALGLRGLVVSGWGLAGAGLPAAPELWVAPYLDYDEILPRCVLAVHHGGATITAAGVRAGLPALVCSSAFDQPFWGTRLERLGVGVHLPFAELTEEVLRSGLRYLMNEEVRRRAVRLGERLAAEPDGTPAAADEIDKYLAAYPGGEQR
jgi:sterol 3beta-glucosyltransferase